MEVLASQLSLQRWPTQMREFSFAFRVSSSPCGRLTEGRGTVPDLVVELRRKDIVDGNDAALEQAIVQMENWP